MTQKPDLVPMESIIRSLTVALGERDHHTRIHSERVVLLSAELGRHLALSAHELEVLSLGAQFHDLGKIGIPDRILRKATPFDDAEWECMKQHAAIGERIVLAIGDDRSPAVARVVRHHHENFDGSGYPDGLGGTAIPLLSRIIMLTDNYDAMAVTRPYHKARNHRAVMDILADENGKKFDPDLLRAFSVVIEKSDMRATDD
ncbi:HD-GYP domain-containing protein [Dechloromonas sp. H13]|uniref:HD-GYP domain-containing protein n=1 Tax=Dechloromonas sp. H13 TaxID=2570193 RepID=UPI001D18B578|nr:HD domain-containing phosphohydrolase [Dechloromonas sp. H13]